MMTLLALCLVTRVIGKTVVFYNCTKQNGGKKSKGNTYKADIWYDSPHPSGENCKRIETPRAGDIRA